jgi:type II secretory pathway pseudopilin PulG
VELLVVIAIIIILLSLLIVGLNLAARASQRANTQSLMIALSQGLERFKSDVGYLPPMLGPNVNELRRFFPPPDPSDATAIQNWWSSCTLAEYLVGYGHHQQDGYGINPNEASLRNWDDEVPPTGIRHPLFDGVWGASRFGGELEDRMKDTGGNYGSETAPHPFDTGQVYGPYIELDDDRLLAGVVYVNGEQRTFFPGEPLPSGETWEDLPKAIVDYWGEPIRYYRRPYPPGALKQPYLAVDRDGNGVIDPVPTLSDVYVLRPFKLTAGSGTDNRFADVRGDPTTSYELNTAEFALLSKGPDRALNEDARADLGSQFAPNEGLNEDNIVEVGP